MVSFVFCYDYFGSFGAIHSGQAYHQMDACKSSLQMNIHQNRRVFLYLVWLTIRPEDYFLWPGYWRVLDNSTQYPSFHVAPWNRAKQSQVRTQTRVQLHHAVKASTCMLPIAHVLTRCHPNIAWYSMFLADDHATTSAHMPSGISASLLVIASFPCDQGTSMVQECMNWAVNSKHFVVLRAWTGYEEVVEYTARREKEIL